MYLTPVQTIVIILAISVSTLLTRLLPFVLFPEGKKHPPIITYLGEALPPAMMGLLVIYCLRNVSFVEFPHGLPEIICVLVVALLHLWKRNVFLSLALGTALYMFLVQSVFI